MVFKKFWIRVVLAFFIGTTPFSSTSCMTYTENATIGSSSNVNVNWKAVGVSAAELVSAVLTGPVRACYEDSVALKGLQALFTPYSKVSTFFSDHKWVRWGSVVFSAIPVFGIFFPNVDLY